MTVTLINDGPLGGVCLNEAAFPPDLPIMQGRRVCCSAEERGCGQSVRNGVAYLLKNPKITIVEGKASFKDAKDRCCKW